MGTVMKLSDPSVFITGLGVHEPPLADTLSFPEEVEAIKAVVSVGATTPTARYGSNRRLIPKKIKLKKKWIALSYQQATSESMGGYFVTIQSDMVLYIRNYTGREQMSLKFKSSQNHCYLDIGPYARPKRV